MNLNCIITTCILVESWILSMRACAWDDSILVYLITVIIFSLVRKTEKMGKPDRKEILACFVAGCIWSALFLGSVYYGHIEGNIIISRLGLKAVMVFIGGGIQFYFWRKLLRNLSKKQMLTGILCIIFLVWAFESQNIFERDSLAGWSLGIWVLTFWKEYPKNTGLKRKHMAKGVLAFLLSMFSVLGDWEVLGARWSFEGSPLRLMALCVLISIAWSIVFYTGLTVLWDWCQGINVSQARLKELTGRKQIERWVLLWCSIFLMWLPYFLCWYPGILSHDSILQVEQALGRINYSNHHPWIHTLLIQVCVRFGMRIGDVNLGVAIYSLVSMAILDTACCCALVYLKKRKIPLWYLVMLWSFFALCPITAIFSVTMWKDVIFAAMVLFFTVVLDGIVVTIAEGKRVRIRQWVQLGLFSVGVCLFRSNGIYAWLFAVPFILWVCREKRQRILCVGTILMVMLVYLFYKGFLLPAYDVEEPDLVESLSIPIQQIGCVIAEEGDVTEQQRLLLEEVIPVDGVKSAYRNYISDPLKNMIRQHGGQKYLQDNLGTYALCYIHLGFQNPYLYVKSYIAQTKGYWYHKVNNWIYYSDGVRTNEMGISRQSKLPGCLRGILERIMRVTENLYHKFFSIALSTWIVLIDCVFAWGKRNPVLIYMLPLGIILTLLIATPVCAEFRYSYAVFLVAPFLTGIEMCRNTVKGGQ